MMNLMIAYIHFDSIAGSYDVKLAVGAVGKRHMRQSYNLGTHLVDNHLAAADSIGAYLSQEGCSQKNL